MLESRNAEPHKPRKYLKSKPNHLSLKTKVAGISLKHPKIKDKIIRQLGLLAKKPGIILSAYSILSNHIHMIIQYDKATDDHRLSLDTLIGDAVRSFTAQVSLAVNRFNKRTGRLFSDRYHLEIMKSVRHIINGFRYVLLNPLKHLLQSRDYLLENDPNSCLYAHTHGLVRLKLASSTQYILTRGEGYGKSYKDIMMDFAYI